MQDINELIHELAAYALTKNGSQLSNGGDHFDPRWNHAVKVPGITWGDFFEVTTEDIAEESDKPVFRFPIFTARLAQYMDASTQLSGNQNGLKGMAMYVCWFPSMAVCRSIC